jgi:hypothetical protein
LTPASLSESTISAATSRFKVPPAAGTSAELFDVDLLLTSLRQP